MTGNKNSSATVSDPLFGTAGQAAARPANQAPAATLATSTPTPPGGMPTLQAPTTTPSVAAMAATSGRPLDPNNALRIGDLQRPPANQTPVATTGGWVAQGTSTANPQGAMLRQPQPIADTTSRQTAAVTPLTSTAPITPLPPMSTPSPAPSAPPAGATLGTPSQPAGVEQLQAQLKARGVLYQKLESSGNGQWTVATAVPTKQNPNISRAYRSTANDPVTALKDVIAQMDQDKN